MLTALLVKKAGKCTFPWFGSSSDQKPRTIILSVASAQRDPRVWDDTAESFELRDVATYHKLSIGWVDHAAVGPANSTSYSKGVPGKGPVAGDGLGVSPRIRQEEGSVAA